MKKVLIILAAGVLLTGCGGKGGKSAICCACDEEVIYDFCQYLNANKTEPANVDANAPEGIGHVGKIPSVWDNVSDGWKLELYTDKGQDIYWIQVTGGFTGGDIGWAGPFAWYAVKKGDTLAEIAENFYGERAYRTKIQKANQVKFRHSKAMRTGMKLIIPP